MAKKKTTHQDQAPQKVEKTHQSDEVSEKIESLKSLNSMLLKETVERRQQVDSLKESTGLLESELKRVEMEKIELGECELMGEIERDLMVVFVGVQVGEILEGFERERGDFERVVREKIDVEKLMKLREDEIEGLKDELSGVVRERDSGLVELKRVCCERDESKRVSDGLGEENGGLKMRIGEMEERERVVRDEVEALRGKCGRLEGVIKVNERNIEGAIRGKSVADKNVEELNKMVDGLKGENVEMSRQMEGVLLDRDLKAARITELESDVSRLNDVVLSLKKEDEKLRSSIGVLEKKCCEGKTKEKELRVEIGKLGKSSESLVAEKGLIEKELGEAVKQSSELKRRVEEILKAKSVVEGAKEKLEGEIHELKIQVTDLKEIICLLEESSRADKEKIKGLESEVGRYRDEVGRIVIERDEARKGLKQEASRMKGLMEKITEKEICIEESIKATEKIKNQMSSLTEQKKELENCQSVLKKDLALAEKKLAETQKELDSVEAKVGLANANSEKMLNMLRSTVTLVSKTKDGNGTVNQVKAGEEFKAYLAALDRIKDAFKSHESEVEDMKLKLESVQHSEAVQKSRFRTFLTSATIVAAAAVAYAARH